MNSSFLFDKIIYQDHKIIVIDKPNGLAVHGGNRVNRSLLTFLKSYDSKFTPFLIHRLDKDTSGILILAKSSNSANYYGQLLSNGKKTYTIICKGRFAKNQLFISEPIMIGDKNYESETKISVINFFGRYSLIKAYPLTGRKHQIRIHLSKIGHPIIGDNKYGDFNLNRSIKKKYKITRMMLHASEVILYPKSKKIKFVSKLPDEMINFLRIYNVKL